LKRAAAVREVLLAVGVPEKLIEMAGRGEREPLIPTDDEIAEPRNRRVEINVQ
jgi:outer membrane protein OmpA-like peptidoglycan-associated protein